MPSDPVSLKGDKTQSWAVTVERNGESVVTLASNCQGGRDLSAEDERVVRLAAEHLLAFIGEAHVPSPVSSIGAEQEKPTTHPPYRCGAWCSHDEEIERAKAAEALRDYSARTGSEGWQTCYCGAVVELRLYRCAAGHVTTETLPSPPAGSASEHK